MFIMHAFIHWGGVVTLHTGTHSEEEQEYDKTLIHVSLGALCFAHFPLSFQFFWCDLTIQNAAS